MGFDEKRDDVFTRKQQTAGNLSMQTVNLRHLYWAFRLFCKYYNVSQIITTSIAALCR